MVNYLKEFLKEISIVDKEHLTDEDYLVDLMLKYGLNGEIEQYLPSNFHKFCGYGLKLAQFPNQFAKYLIKLSELEINTYLEIGTRYGGSFIWTVEYLKRFNKDIQAVCVDIIDIQPNLIEYSKHNDFNFIQLNTMSDEFKIWIDKKEFDLTMVDGNHKYHGVKSDYNLVKDKSKIIVLHDIVMCQGVIDMWNEVKNDYEYTYEFIDQYKGDVLSKDFNKFLGIGVLQ